MNVAAEKLQLRSLLFARLYHSFLFSILHSPGVSSQRLLDSLLFLSQLINLNSKLIKRRLKEERRIRELSVCHSQTLVFLRALLTPLEDLMKKRTDSENSLTLCIEKGSEKKAGFSSYGSLCAICCDFLHHSVVEQRHSPLHGNERDVLLRCSISPPKN